MKIEEMRARLKAFGYDTGSLTDNQAHFLMSICYEAGNNYIVKGNLAVRPANIGTMGPLAQQETESAATASAPPSMEARLLAVEAFLWRISNPDRMERRGG